MRAFNQRFKSIGLLGGLILNSCSTKVQATKPASLCLSYLPVVSQLSTKFLGLGSSSTKSACTSSENTWSSKKSSSLPWLEHELEAEDLAEDFSELSFDELLLLEEDELESDELDSDSDS